jgi:RNA polymerase sigma factor (sigma-70 family)
MQRFVVFATVSGVDRDSTTSFPPASAGLEVTYRRHFPALVRVAFLITGSAAAAEDAVHEVFVRCAHRIESLDHPESYLRAAVVNECRTQHRRSRRGETHRTVAINDHLPTEHIETRDALAALTPRQRAAIVLRYFEDLPEAEIAEVLRCRPATVRSLISRALGTLRKELA